MVKKIAALLVVFSAVIFSGCLEKESKQEDFETLKLLKLKSESEPYKGIKASNYSKAPVRSEVVFNWYRVSYEVLANDYEVETPSGIKYRAVVTDYETGEKVGRAKILLLKMVVEKVNEKGIDPLEVKKSMWLLPLLPFPVKVEKEFTAFNTYLGLGEMVAEPWNYVVDSNADFLCSFDTNTSIERAYGACMFVYPENADPEEIIFAVNEQIVARIPLY